MRRVERTERAARRVPARFPWTTIPLVPMATTSQPTPSSVGGVRPPAGVEVVPVIDFGAQYVQLIARRVREAGAFSMLVSPSATYEEIAALKE